MDKSLKPSEKEALIAFIKANKKKFYKGLWKWYPVSQEVISKHHVIPSVIRSLINKFNDDYTLISEINCIYLCVSNGVWEGYIPGISLRHLVFIHKKYWHRFEKYYYLAPKRKHLPRPFMKKTTAVKEFLFRGFIHKDDAINFRGRKYTIESTIAPLVWPEGFDTHSEACEKSAKVGIPGYTKCPIPS